MKKLLTILSFLFLLTPLSAFASINVSWNATSTDKGYISPNLVNGNNPDVKLNGALTINTLTGILKAVSGVVQTALVDLTADVTGILPVANGGTGAASFTAGSRFVISNGTGAFTSVAAPLTVSNGGTGSTTLSGILKGNGTGIVATAVPGTDYTLITANTCGAGNHVSAITALGVITCSPDTGSGSSAFPFTPATIWGVNTSATTTPIWGQAGIFASSTSATIPALSVSYTTGPAAVFGLGNVGIGSSSPSKLLSVGGNSWFSGNLAHFGDTVSNNSSSACGTAANCFEFVGNDNTTGGVVSTVQNISSGASAYGGFSLLNSLVGTATTNYSGLYLNSALYNDSSFGSANNFPNLLQLANSMGGVSIQSFAPTTAASYVNIIVASTTPGAGPSTSSEVARFTSAGVGVGTTTAAAASVSIDANNTTTKPGLSLASQGTPYFSVASSTRSVLFVGTSTPAVGSESATSTIYMQKIQFQGGNSSGTTVCMYVVGTTPTVTSGSCPL